MNKNLRENGGARRGEQGTNARHRNSDIECRKTEKSLREIERGLARRLCHRPAVRLRRLRAIESVLNALTQLLLLRELIHGISHRTGSLHDPLLETGERSANAALRDAEAENRRAVARVLLRVTHEFEGVDPGGYFGYLILFPILTDIPQPRDGDEGETTLAENGQRLCILVLR